MRVARSTDGGHTFNNPQQIASFTPYAPNLGGQRDCGDGPFFCGDPGFVFHRVPLEPRLTADQTGAIEGVFATWNAVDARPHRGEQDRIFVCWRRTGGAIVGVRVKVR